MKNLSVLALLILMAGGAFTNDASAQSARWSEQKANSWYAQQPWLVGSNYIPKSAINQLEMWQEATFNPAEIDQEFGWAEAMGMNTMRVFLHDLLWQQDPAGFQKRINAISDDRAIRVIISARCLSSLTPAGILCPFSGRSIHRSRESIIRAGYRARAQKR